MFGGLAAGAKELGFRFTVSGLLPFVLLAAFTRRDGAHRRSRRPVRHRAAPLPPPKTARSARTCRPTPRPGPKPPAVPRTGSANPDQVYSTTPAPLPSAEGYRIVWVHSSAKAGRDAAGRQARIEAAVAGIEALDSKLAGPRSRFKTPVAVEQAATAALTDAHAERWVTMTESVTKTYKQQRAGRPGPKTRYQEILTSRFALQADIALDHMAYDAASDGCFPLITNDRGLTDAEVLAAYRYQPNLERRHHLLKSVQDAAPVLLHNPARIEALFCCQFLALLVNALLEREVRNGMRQAELDDIPLYPEFRCCTAPSAERILEIFAPVARHQLYRDGVLVQTFQPELSAQQRQVLDLLRLPCNVYSQPT